MICKLVGSSFYLFEETFDAVPIPVSEFVESEPVSVECSVELGAESTRNTASWRACFSRSSVRNCSVSAWGRVGKTDEEDSVDVRVDGGVQPKVLVMALDHRLGQSDVFRTPPSTGWRSAFCTQLCTIDRDRSTPKLSRTEMVSESDKPSSWNGIFDSILRDYRFRIPSLNLRNSVSSDRGKQFTTGCRRLIYSPPTTRVRITSRSTRR